MLKFIAKRLANYVVMLFVAVSFTYFMASAFMHPRSNYEARTPRPPQDSIERTLDLANVNDHTPVLERYWNWLTAIVTRWDWGKSPTLESVNGAIAPRILASTELVTLSTVLSIVLGVALGIYTAQRQYKWQDRVFTITGTFFMVIPSAVLALLIVLMAIAVNDTAGFRLFYVTGLSSYTGDNWGLRITDFLQHIILPTISLTLLGMVGYHLTQRTYLLDELHADYVRTARMKGLTRRQAVRRHALRASLIPTAVNVAFSIASVFTGAVITESIFAINGLGRYFITAINNNDINASVAIAAFGGVCTLTGALLADIFSAWLDPRIKMS
ncbi:ABC transporter permease [Bifidobacterium avesanii]|uniref:ABC transporter permease subunit n=1 Tax=Bifidobacterium avesanii TaxID=1798157 RepID=A0A7K3TID5_9BIFI|nr:ABC transporter permease [Bifidobacterium avesanii]KAB8289894.1 ABC transporter permease [Bifidobacterium avesanii]NEG78865.1 ABC transporter permease subunit [Bifidobacterium avesanii]